MEPIPWILSGFALGALTIFAWYRFDHWRKWRLILRAIEGPNVVPVDGFKLHDGSAIRRPRDRPNVIPFPPKEAA